MMSLKPRNVDFQETWANLKETVAGVVGLKPVERCVWNTRFSDVYALCVAHPEPLADRLYDETRNFLEEHVAGLLQRVRGPAPLENNDHNDGLLERYVSAWSEYSQGVAYLNSLYSYLNLQHVKRQKVSDAEIIYGSAATVSCPDHDSRQLEVGELGLVTWERVLVRPLASALSARIVSALTAARAAPPDPRAADILRHAIHSTVHVQSFRVRSPLALYQELVLEPYLEAASQHHSAFAAELLQNGDISEYMKHVLDGLEREMALGNRFLHSSSTEAVRGCYERCAVAAHLPALHADTQRLLHDATADTPHQPERREDLKRMYALLKPLPGGALRPLVDAAHAQAMRDGQALLAAPHNKDEAHTHFVTAMLALHGKYLQLFQEVFSGAQAFIGALDKACSAVVNSRDASGVARAPELLARYCDTLLRKRTQDTDTEPRLQAAIVVFKYVDDKDVFQKYYARALARRLIHQLSASMEQMFNNNLNTKILVKPLCKMARAAEQMATPPPPVDEPAEKTLADYMRQWGLETYIPKFLEHSIDIETLQMLSEADLRDLVPIIGHRAKLSTQIKLLKNIVNNAFEIKNTEEAMINRLKAACGYEFTNKLHRMFTDVAVSGDLNAKFQQHLRDTNQDAGAGFSVQVLQAGAWPLGGAMAPLAPPAQLERPARLFEAFYRASFSGRRLAWLHHLCTGDLRTRYTPRPCHVSATTPQCALLLCFENVDTAPARELRDSLQLNGDAWARHLRPLLDIGLLSAQGEVESDECEGTLSLNLAFTCKRTKIRLTCATAPQQQGVGVGGGGGGGETEAAHCDDDRKMYLQAALVRIMKQRKVLRHTELIQEVVSQARGSFAPSVAMIKKCIEALIDKQYLERAPGSLDTYNYLA